MNDLLYQTNLSDFVVLNALKYYKEIIQIHFSGAQRLKFFYKKIEDSLLTIFLGCLIVSNKIIDDCSFTLKTWSTLSKIPLKKLFQLEISIMNDFLGFKLLNMNFVRGDLENWNTHIEWQVAKLEKVYKMMVNKKIANFTSVPEKSKCVAAVSQKRNYITKELVQPQKMSINNLLHNTCYTPPHLALTKPMFYSVQQVQQVISPIYNPVLITPPYSCHSLNSSPANRLPNFSSNTNNMTLISQLQQQQQQQQHQQQHQQTNGYAYHRNYNAAEVSNLYNCNVLY